MRHAELCKRLAAESSKHPHLWRQLRLALRLDHHLGAHFEIPTTFPAIPRGSMYNQVDEAVFGHQAAALVVAARLEHLEEARLEEDLARKREGLARGPMSARQKYNSDALLATGRYSSDVLLTSTDVTSASCMRMLTSFDLCIDR